MIELWDEKPKPVNNWREINARRRTNHRAWTIWVIELITCLAIGAVFGWMYGRAW